MLPMTVGEFARRAGATLVDIHPDTAFYSFATDDREAGPGALFLAIKGSRVDGHDFVPMAMRNGAVAAVVEREVEDPHILVSNLVEALAKMASSFRDEFDGVVVGVTGSAGKTTTKEFVAAALSPLGYVGKTEGNRNTELTAPLAWAELRGTEAAMVVEMSMRGFGQIEHLASFSRPRIGIVTGIGSNHIEKVGSIEGVAKAKAELLESLPSDGIGIIFHEDRFGEYLRSRAACPVLSFGWERGADARLLSYRPKNWRHSEFEIELGGKKFGGSLKFAGRHMVQNAAAALLAAVGAGVEPSAAIDAIASADLPSMRMEVIDTEHGTIVLDAYNAAPESFIAAIRTLAEVPAPGRKIVIAGDMRELGDAAERGHRAVGAAIAEHGIDRLITVGELARSIAEEAVKGGLSPQSISQYDSVGDASQELSRFLPDDTILIKGSRAVELERILEAVQEGAGATG